MQPPSDPLPIYRRFPSLEQVAPRIPLCALPTPVEPMTVSLAPGAIASLYVKRDDQTATPYGGNKVRKLEFLLGQARQVGAKETITFGYAGSNHALATAIYAGRAGLRPTSILLPQPNAHYVRRNLLAGRAAGARLIARDSVRAIAATVAWRTMLALLRTGRRPFIIPAGGSSTRGVLGYVNAAFELADQIKAGACPAPDRIYVSLGSMGSTAGLMAGFTLTGDSPEVHAVRVVDTRFANSDALHRLIEATLDQLREWLGEVSANGKPNLVIRDEFFGHRYGEFTEAGVHAVQQARESAALRLDGTYSGKAFAALLADADAGNLRGKHVLFWNTHNARDVDALGAGTEYHALPRAFHRYFEEPVQPLDPGA